jgi:hypothetical protein
MQIVRGAASEALQIQQKINMSMLECRLIERHSFSFELMTASTERQTISFVIRLWREPSADATQWRGQIEHVGSGDTAHFQFSNGLWQFLMQHVEFLPLPPSQEPLPENKGSP